MIYICISIWSPITSHKPRIIIVFMAAGGDPYHYVVMGGNHRQKIYMERSMFVCFGVKKYMETQLFVTMT